MTESASTALVELDGSLGEGGGQILRTALSLSMVTGRPFRIERIRAGRAKPGLLRQHLTAVLAAQRVCGAEVEGAAIGSTVLTFQPGPVRPGEYTFAIGSAGSTTLVLQTLLPALMVGDSSSSLTIEGGTHNIYAPSVDFLTRTFLPLLERMGPRVALDLERHGFYPRGGGRISARITPCKKLKPIELLSRGEARERRAIASVAGLSGEIAKRELKVIQKKLGWETIRIQQLDDDVGPGNVLSLEIESEHVTEVITGFGRKGVSAEEVASAAVKEARTYLAGDHPVGPHLADQLMLPFAMAGAGAFRSGPLTPHARTNASVIAQFLDTEIASEDKDGAVVTLVRGKEARTSTPG